jgi:uncharacterized lipoprotein YddW (UPF0748 family)
MREIFLFLIICIFFLVGFSSNYVKAEVENSNSIHQFRGVWVATVANIDIAKQSTIADYKDTFLNMLDTLEEYNLNTIVFQVRPTNDAFYKSELNPWSKYLSSIQGKDPGWDPLEWMIEESHKRGIEFHAWLNPYRVALEKVAAGSYDSKEELLGSLNDLNFAKKNPDKVVLGGDGIAILNPGEPSVKEFIVDTIEEIIVNYDVDAIHFDDYFYPYKGIANSDQVTYNTYKQVGQSLNDWRRSNVDEVIKNISDLIKDHNLENQKAVQFGISPFGIWRNVGTDPIGSDTNGSQSYDVQYADTRKWVKEEWIDYIAPQLYWKIGTSVADYVKLVPWWADVVKGTKVNLYIGQGFYRYDDGTSGAWTSSYELQNQLNFNEDYPEVKGSILYSYKHLLRNNSTSLTIARNTLKNIIWNTNALHPLLQRMDTTRPGQISNLASEVSYSSGVSLSWDRTTNGKYYVVYRFEKDQEIDLNNETIIDIIGNNSLSNSISFSDSSAKAGNEYTYHITVVSLQGKEGLSYEVTLKVPNDPEDTHTTEPQQTTEETTASSQNTFGTTTNQSHVDENPKDEDKSNYFILYTLIGILSLSLIGLITTKLVKKAN